MTVPSPTSTPAGSVTVPSTELAPILTVGGGQCGTGDVVFVDAQFAFVGTVTEIAGEFDPRDVDAENPDRPERPALTPWVTFDVDGWYTSDWGSTFRVWMPQHAVEVGDRVAVAGDARHVGIEGFSGQSGEVEFCSSADGDGALSSWDAYFGSPVVAGAGVPEGAPNPAVIAEIDAAETAWSSMNMTSYSYLLSVYDPRRPEGECDVNFARVVVEADEIIEAVELRPVFGTQTGCNVEPVNVPTVSELFDRARATAGATSFSFLSDLTTGVVLEFRARDRSVEFEARVSGLSPATDRAVVGWPDVSTAAADARARWSTQSFDHEVTVADSEGERAYFNISTTVVDGTVVEVRNDGEIVDPETLEQPWTPYTVDGVFDLIDELADDGAVVAVFDASTGAPTNVWFDPLPNAIDDELAKTITIHQL
jgi:hypothetical protein